MTDYELRGKLLGKLYGRRREGLISIGADGFQDSEAREEARIAQQLAEHGLILFKPANDHMGGRAQITAQGVDVIEGHAKSGIAINIDQSRAINIRGSSNFQIGDHNSQTIHAGVRALIETINTATADPSEKAEAKSLLRKFLEHPLVCAVAGNAIGLLRH